jgi:hypothetical protein
VALSFFSLTATPSFDQDKDIQAAAVIAKMASTDPTAVEPELNFINTTPANFLQSVDSGRRDEDDNMNSHGNREGYALKFSTPQLTECDCDLLTPFQL